MLGHLQPNQLTPLMIGALVSEWRKRLRRNTVVVYTNKLRSLLRTLYDAGAPPIKTPKVPPRTPRPTIATGEELGKLFANPPAFLRLFMLLYFQCGLRRAETLRVTPRSWNREQHTATLEVKGGGVHTISLTPDVESLMEGCGPQEPDTSFISALHGRPISTTSLRSAWEYHRQRCGVNPQLNAHDLRRSAATIIYHATHDLRAAQQLLGHKNLSSTLTYLAPMAPEEARRYQELLRFDKFHTDTKQ